MRRRLSFLSAIVMFAGTACWPFSDDAPLTEMTLKLRSGPVEVLRGDETLEVGDRIALQPDDVIVTGRGADAVLRLQGERVIELLGTGQTRITSETSVENQKGNLLARAKDRTRVTFGDVEASATDAVFRVDRAFAVARAGSYDGSITLSAPGRPVLNVDDFFQVSVTANEIQGVVPYHVSESDPWDLRLLSDVLDLEDQLAELRNGLSLRLGRDRPGLDYFSTLAGRKVPFMKRYLSRPTADLLTGFTIADNDDGRGLKRSFVRAFSLFDSGGRWGVIAAILDVPFRPVVAQLDEVIVATGAVASGGAAEAEFSVAAAAEAAGDAPVTLAAGPSETGGSGPTGGSEPSGGDDPPKKPKTKPSEEPDDCGDFVTCQIQDAEDRLNPSPSPSPSGIRVP